MEALVELIKVFVVPLLLPLEMAVTKVPIDVLLNGSPLVAVKSQVTNPGVALQGANKIEAVKPSGWIKLYFEACVPVIVLVEVTGLLEPTLASAKCATKFRGWCGAGEKCYSEPFDTRHDHHSAQMVHSN